MKNFLLKTWLTMLCLLVGVGTSWAEEVVYKTAVFSKNSFSKGVQNYTSSFSSTTDEFEVELKNFNNNNKGWDFVRTGNKNLYSVGTITTIKPIDKPITKVVITIDAITTDAQTIYLKSINSSDEEKDEGNFTKAVGNQTVAIASPASDRKYCIYFECNKGTSNGLIQVSKIDFYVEETTTPTKTLSSIAVSGTPTKTTYVEGDEFDPSGLTVTGTYSDNSTATITEGITWNVTPETLTAGTTSVSVTATVNNVASAAYTVNGLTVNAISEKSIADFIESKGGRCYLIGTVSDIKSTTYGNYTLTDASGSIYVYGTLTPNGETQKFASLGIEEGDKIKVLANEYELYNGTKEAKNVVFVEKIESAPSVTKYNITIADDIANGTVTTNTNEAEKDATITLTATPATGYEFTSWNVTNASTSEAITVTDNKFTMPASDVTVSATFTEVQQGGGDEPAGRPENEIFYESFDTNNGTGGNDNQWSGSIATNDIQSDNDDWTFVKGNGANQCAKFGTSSVLGSATTPALGQACNATLTFKAAAWNGNSENTTLKLSIVGEGSISPSTVELKKGEWSTYTVSLTGLAASSKIKFEGEKTSNSRFFLDEISVVKTGNVKNPTTLKWSFETATATIGAENTFPTLTTSPADLSGVTYSSSETGVAIIDSSTGSIELVGVGETTITASYAGDETFAPATDASYTLTVSVAPIAKPTHNATFHINGKTTTKEVEEGEEIVFPTNPGDIGEKTFTGWTKSEIENPQNSAPEYVVKATMGVADMDFYAVFATKEGGLITKTLTWEPETDENWSVTNVIIRTQANDKYHANTGDYYGLLSSNCSVQFKEKVKVKSFSYYCVRRTNNTNTSIKIETSTNGSEWTEANSTTWGTFQNDGKTYKKIEKTWEEPTECYVRLNIVTSAQRQLDDVSITYGDITYTDYCTIVGSTRTIESIDVTTPPYQTEYVVGDKFNPEGIVVTAYYSDNTSEEIDNSNLSFVPDERTSLSLNDESIEITYRGHKTTQAIVVRNLYDCVVTYYVNGVATTENIKERDVLNRVPKVETMLGEKVFTGWVKTVTVDKNVVPQYVDMKKERATIDAEYFAVFATRTEDTSGEAQWIKVPLDNTFDWTADGNQYVMVFDNGDGSGLVYNADKETSSTNATNCTIENNIITYFADGKTVIEIGHPSDSDNSLVGLKIAEGAKKDYYLNSGKTTATTDPINLNLLNVDKFDNAETYTTFTLESNHWNIQTCHSSLIYDSNLKKFKYNSSYVNDKAVDFFVKKTVSYSDFTTNMDEVSIAEACVDSKSGFHYGTYCNEKAFVAPSNMTVAVVGIKETEKTLIVEPIDKGKAVPANTGVMISSKNFGKHYFAYAIDETVATPQTTNYLHPSSESMETVEGDNLFYKLTMHNGTQIGFWWGAAEGAAFTMGKNKAYLAVPKAIANSIKSNMWVDEEGTLTEIDNIELTPADNTIYNLQGQRINRADKGVYIVNGRKVIR